MAKFELDGTNNVYGRFSVGYNATGVALSEANQTPPAINVTEVVSLINSTGAAAQRQLGFSHGLDARFFDELIGGALPGPDHILEAYLISGYSYDGNAAALGYRFRSLDTTGAVSNDEARLIVDMVAGSQLFGQIVFRKIHTICQ